MSKLIVWPLPQVLSVRNPSAKDGAKGSQYGGVKVDQWKVMDLRGGWRLERRGRRHPPRSGFGGG